MPLQTNALYYGDNLRILREHIPDESIDLIYLDPPFNSNRSYNVLFKETSSAASQAQIEAFEDTWHWGGAAQDTFEDIALHGGDDTARLLKAMVDALGHNDVTAYLTMMAVRLIELRRVLKSNGSIYLHCDPTASHYLKILMDAIFGPKCFRNEITWQRTSAHSDTKQGMRRYGKVRDILLFYTKTSGSGYEFHEQYTEYTPAYVESEYRHRTPDGRNYKETDLTAAKPGGDTEYEWRVKRPLAGKERWQADLESEHLKPRDGWEYKGVRPYRGRYWAYSKSNMEDFAKRGLLIHRETGMPRLMQFSGEMLGVPLQDLWDDIPPASGGEDLGYPTQKPLALLERIIKASSSQDGIVLDPFCGCGTAIHAAHRLGRRWIGIDLTHLAIGLVRRRMEDAFAGLKIDVVGEPVDLSGAQELARNDPFQFQWWAVDKIDAQPAGEKRKGMDRGIDGIIPFIEGRADRRRVIVSVKGGGVSSRDIRDLKGVLEREGEPIGVLVTLKPPTREMTREAIAAGHYESEFWQRKYPRIQILTVEDILSGKKVDAPTRDSIFARPERERQQEGEQGALLT
jgi:DNA modification methylase